MAIQRRCLPWFLIRSLLLPYFCLPILISGVCAQTLTELYDTALSHEPTYQGAVANLTAVQERWKQARSVLLPQISASLSTNTNDRTYTTYEARVPASSDQYNSNNEQLNLTQPIWHHADAIAISQAEMSVQQAEYQRLEAEQELAVKLVSAWCDVMSARDTVTFSTYQVHAATEVWRIAKQGVALGIQSDVSSEEAKAKYEEALANQTAAETELQLKIAALEQITGTLPSVQSYDFLPDVNVEPLKPKSLDYWVTHVESKSPAILAAAYALKVASNEVNKRRAGYEPTVELVGSYGVNKQHVGNFPGQSAYQIDQKTVGLQVNIPLYSGGGQGAKVAEAIALEEKARQDLEAAKRSVIVAIKQAWFGWQAAWSRRSAALEAMKSSEMAVKASLREITKGIKVERDHLDAQQKLEGAKRDVNKARYDLVVAAFKLKATLGYLHRSDIAELDRRFFVEKNGKL